MPQIGKIINYGNKLELTHIQNQSMKLLLSLLFIVVGVNKVNSQTKIADTVIYYQCTPVRVMQKIDTKKWESFINSVTQNDSIQKAGNIPSGIYIVEMGFAISRTGIIVQTIPHTDPGYGLLEYVRQKLLINDLQWEPAMLNGRIVKAYERHQFIFKIGEVCKNLPDMQYL